MGQASIFAGSKVKTLKGTLNLNGGADVISSTTDPTAVAVSANPGSILLNTTTGKQYKKNDSGSTTNWTEVGAGSSGKNYIQNPKFNSNATTSWSLNTLTVDGTTKAVSGNVTTGAASITTFAASQTTPLEGAYSLLVEGVAIAQGAAFLSDAFAIDREDMAKVQQFSFAYEAVSGAMNFSGTKANTWAVWIAEVTVAAPNTVINWIQPAGVYNLVQSSGVGICTGTFQTSATGTAYRIAVVCITAPGVSVSMKFDDFRVGPQVTSIAPAMSDWVAYTPTWTGSSSNPAIGNGTLNGRWRRVGSNMEVEISAIMGSTTTYGSGEWYFGIPLGYAIDTSSLATTNGSDGSAVTGIARAYCGTSYALGAVTPGRALGNNIQGVAIAHQTTGTFWTNSQPGAWTNTNSLSVFFTVPISGWSSNTVSSADTDTRVVSASLYKTANQSIANATQTTITFSAAGVADDSHASWNGTDTYTLPVAGRYLFSGTLSWVGTGGVGLSKVWLYNISTDQYLGSDFSQKTSSSDFSQPFAFQTGHLPAGTKVAILFRQDVGGTISIAGSSTNKETRLNIQRLSGAAVVQASESVSFSNQIATPTGILGAASNLVTYPAGTTSFDSHAAYSSGTYTVPVSGKYLVSAGFGVTHTSVSNGQTIIYIAHKGSLKFQGKVVQPSGVSGADPNVSGILNCIAGDTIQIYSFNNNTSPAFAATNQSNYLNITRVGN